MIGLGTENDLFDPVGLTLYGIQHDNVAHRAINPRLAEFDVRRATISDGGIGRGKNKKVFFLKSELVEMVKEA